MESPLGTIHSPPSGLAPTRTKSEVSSGNERQEKFLESVDKRLQDENDDKEDVSRPRNERSMDGGC